MGVVFAPVAFVNGDDLVADKTPNVIQIADDGDSLVGMLRRHRVIVAMKPHRRKRIRVSQFDASGFEFLFRQRQ